MGNQARTERERRTRQMQRVKYTPSSSVATLASDEASVLSIPATATWTAHQRCTLSASRTPLFTCTGLPHTPHTYEREHRHTYAYTQTHKHVRIDRHTCTQHTDTARTEGFSSWPMHRSSSVFHSACSGELRACSFISPPPTPPPQCTAVSTCAHCAMCATDCAQKDLAH